MNIKIVTRVKFDLPALSAITITGLFPEKPVRIRAFIAFRTCNLL
jgi:hypothetical protein